MYMTAQMSCKDFEMRLAFHSAPSMLGIKPSCLFSLDKNSMDVTENVSRFNRKAAGKNLKITVLCECRKRQLLLVYNRELLEKHIFSPDVQSLFRRFGYGEDLSFDEYIDRLAHRISQNGNFPHEVGLFLGYPTEDVVGFIENKGERYLMCGYWKVYSDEDRAKRTFSNYNKCRKYLCGRLEEGDDIYKALKIS